MDTALKWNIMTNSASLDSTTLKTHVLCESCVLIHSNRGWMVTIISVWESTSPIQPVSFLFIIGGKVGRLWQEMESAEAWWRSHGHQIAEGSAAALIAHGCISNVLGKLVNWVNKAEKYGHCGQAFHVRLDFMIFNMLNSSQLKWKKDWERKRQVSFSILSLHWPQLWWTRRPYCNVEGVWSEAAGTYRISAGYDCLRVHNHCTFHKLGQNRFYNKLYTQQKQD